MDYYFSCYVSTPPPKKKLSTYAGHCIQQNKEIREASWIISVIEKKDPCGII